MIIYKSWDGHSELGGHANITVHHVSWLHGTQPTTSRQLVADSIIFCFPFRWAIVGLTDQWVHDKITQ